MIILLGYYCRLQPEENCYFKSMLNVYGMLEYYRSGYIAVTKMEYYNLRFFLDNNLSNEVFFSV